MLQRHAVFGRCGDLAKSEGNRLAALEEGARRLRFEALDRFVQLVIANDEKEEYNRLDDAKEHDVDFLICAPNEGCSPHECFNAQVENGLHIWLP